jgi:tRNA-2-methylthio-N6-dimethylallyladenosine synthase
MEKTLHITTYGCQMNVYDSQRMEEMLSILGYHTVEGMDADVSIFNTCQIREKAEEKLFSDLGRMREIKGRRTQKGQFTTVVVAGCSAQALGAHILKRAPYVDLVLGPQTYDKMPELLAQIERQRTTTEGPGRGILRTGFPKISKFDTLKAPRKVDGASAFLSIQEGCDKFCKYCVVPYTRGAEYSRPLQDILEEANVLLAQGAKEITVLGQNVNAYHGKDAQGNTVSFSQLLRSCAELKGLDRLRYTTSHPREMTPDLIQIHKELPQLMPFLHLPVQSGSDRVLQEMNRQYTVREYEKIIQNMREARPGIGFSSDFIVGHPGEEEEDFEKTCALAERVQFAQAYSFMYSPRPGTPSALQPQIPLEIKKARLHRLQAILWHSQRRFNQSMEGTCLPVLFEKSGKKPGQLIGKSPYMQSVYVEAPEEFLGRIIPVDIQRGYLNSLSGVLSQK